jgi:hypothetical protein
LASVVARVRSRSASLAGDDSALPDVRRLARGLATALDECERLRRARRDQTGARKAARMLADGRAMFDAAEIISRDSRADAIRDGVLIDVSATAREAGFEYPVALTAAA